MRPGVRSVAGSRHHGIPSIVDPRGLIAHRGVYAGQTAEPRSWHQGHDQLVDHIPFVANPRDLIAHHGEYAGQPAEPGAGTRATTSRPSPCNGFPSWSVQPCTAHLGRETPEDDGNGVAKQVDHPADMRIGCDLVD